MAGALVLREFARVVQLADDTESGVRVQAVDGDRHLLAVLARLYAQLESGERFVACRYAIGIGLHRSAPSAIWKQYVGRRRCRLIWLSRSGFWPSTASVAAMSKTLPTIERVRCRNGAIAIGLTRSLRLW